MAVLTSMNLAYQNLITSLNRQSLISWGNLTSTLHSRKHQMNWNFCFALGPTRTRLPGFATVYDTVGTHKNYDSVRELSMGTNEPSPKRWCSIYKDCCDRRNEDMPNTICAMQVRHQYWSHLSEDVVGATIGNFQPEVQNGMICGNLKTTQEVLAFFE